VTEIRLDTVRRSFGETKAVDGISLTVADGELFTLLGPSGCGKTTLLRMIAGFCDLDAGSIWFGPTRIDRLLPHRRNIGMMFQSYAVFPNLTVAQNVAYGLRARKLPEPEIRTRVGEALAMARMSDHGARWPHELSGGQLQRVAIARALVIKPAVLLFDEPLSNLDAQLRTHMRVEIRQLQQTLGTTAIYVTHDQEEALAISDRIAVLRAGGVEQVGAPETIYRAPQTAFVAEFLGSANLLPGVVSGFDGTHTLVDAGGTAFRVCGQAAVPGTKMLLSIRPESIRVTSIRVTSIRVTPSASESVTARLQTREFLGGTQRLHLLLPDGTALRVAALGGAEVRPDPEGRLGLTYDPADIILYPAP
jgi:ABC-type Fe3+/spermidine/putrescine transport system ATPase subunit